MQTGALAYVRKVKILAGRMVAEEGAPNKAEGLRRLGLPLGYAQLLLKAAEVQDKELFAYGCKGERLEYLQLRMLLKFAQADPAGKAEALEMFVSGRYTYFGGNPFYQHEEAIVKTASKLPVQSNAAVAQQTSRARKPAVAAGKPAVAAGKPAVAAGKPAALGARRAVGSRVTASLRGWSPAEQREAGIIESISDQGRAILSAGPVGTTDRECLHRALLGSVEETLVRGYYPDAQVVYRDPGAVTTAHYGPIEHTLQLQQLGIRSFTKEGAARPDLVMYSEARRRIIVVEAARTSNSGTTTRWTNLAPHFAGVAATDNKVVLITAMVRNHDVARVSETLHPDSYAWTAEQERDTPGEALSAPVPRGPVLQLATPGLTGRSIRETPQRIRRR